MRINVGILGFGTVGAGVYKILTENHKDIMHRENIDMNVKRVLVRDFINEPNINLALKSVFTTNVQDIVNDLEIDIVVECMGGTEPARTFILAMLNQGKTVVTSNKEVIAKHWPELEQAAKDHDCDLYIEATVGGGIPIIRTLTDSMQANNITNVMGIINGTTNYILTKMSQEGKPFDEVLSEAQKLGYAEANPTNDVEAWDVVYKLSILSSIAFHARIPLECIYREGITKVSPKDIEVAKDMGYIIKLLAIGKKYDGMIEVRVHPTLIPSTHPLAAVNGVFNAILIKGHAVDDIMLYGRGAGQMPTASAVVSDIITASHKSKHGYMTFRNFGEMSSEISLVKDWESGYFIRITVEDKPGVLAKISGIFGETGVSVQSMMQKGNEDSTAHLVFITHKAKELAMQAAMRRIQDLDVVKKIDSILHVEK